MRSGLAGVRVVALALASCATIPTPHDANDAVLMLRKYDAWAWAAGVALICADLVLPVPQTVVIAALGIIYGTVFGGLLSAALYGLPSTMGSEYGSSGSNLGAHSPKRE